MSIQNLPEILKKHKLSQEEYEQIKTILGREPNLVEIGIFSAMWSEHCSYKSSKIYLRGFPTTAPWVIQGPGENAGVIDITKGYSAVFKVESHNHPSFIEPHSGAATGVGGIMRDVFTMGARPIASLNAICFGRIDQKASPDSTMPSDMAKLHQRLLKGVVSGIGHYGNCIGVPTVGGETYFDSCFNGNVLCNAFMLGIAKSDEIFYGRAEGINNPVIYAGSKTGRDGLGGAVMSSDSFDEESKNLRPTVQVGDPFSGKLLLEACLELFKKDLIVGIQDMGAAGLTSSSFEMAARSGSGMALYLDKVPMREEGMNPYELMLSESQERMLICAKKGCEEAVCDIFRKWDIDVAIIGEVTNSGHMELYWHDELCAHIPIAPITDLAPMLSRPISKPSYLDTINTQNFKPKIENLENTLYEMLGSIEVGSKKMIYERFDSLVGTNTLIAQDGGDASLVRVKENNTALAMSIYAPYDYCYLDPKKGGEIAVATAGRKCAIRGARALAISDCLNFGNPENPEVMWQFKEVCEGIKNACAKLNTPVVSGNVSLYNQTNDKDIHPTPTIVSVGLIADAKDGIDSALKGGEIILLGEWKEEFGGSLIQKMQAGKISGKAPELCLDTELRLWDLLIELNSKKLLSAAKNVGTGGVIISLCKMAFLGNIGFECQSGLESHMLFSQPQSLVLAESLDSTSVLKIAKDFNIPARIIGKSGGNTLQIDGVKIPLDKAKNIYEQGFIRHFE